jgi:UPF0176 protein
MAKSNLNIVVVSLYRFTKLPDFESFRNPLYDLMVSESILGTFLLAPEGINGTVAGPRKGIDATIEWLEKDIRFSNLEIKESYVDKQPFYRTKVKLKKEIVTMGIRSINPNELVGTYVDPDDWNELIGDPDVLLIDTRNDYEVKIGSFANSVNLETASFREFPDKVTKNLRVKNKKKIAMFCTGGIRCEKSTAYLKQQGFENIFHLRGGILNYLKKIPEKSSMWRGECFVFDNRVTVNHNLEKGCYDQCHACRMPITNEEKKHKNFKKGISCHYCAGQHTNKQIKRYEDREEQVMLAKKRGEVHLGSSMESQIYIRKKKKIELKNKQRKADKE